MPTKRKRHMITETAGVEAALEPLRARGIPVNFQHLVIKGAEADTTNNRMEMMAAIEALAALTRPSRIALTTDSQYLRQGISDWLPRWKANGWRTAAKKPVKNQDLWERLDAVAVGHQIEWHWVKGHSGHPENELVDSAANDAIDEMLGTI